VLDFLIDIDHVMPERTDQAERSLQQLSMEELAARYFYVSQQYGFLQRQHTMIQRFTPEGRRLRIARVRAWQRKRKQNRRA
jgi:hypothetical protein